MFIFAVSYFLEKMPYKNQEIAPNSYPKLLRILLLYIVMPLLTIYTIILYMYFLKVLLTWKWPIGIVSNLVLWYSVIVTVLLFFITPIREEVNFANKFLKFAPKILLPLLIMMFISIGIRINAYGITESRYYVVILALWVFFIMLYFCFSKKLRNIIIPVTLSIVTLISVLGPLSSYSISKMSQNNRLQKILIKNNMLKDRKLQTSTNISSKDKEEVLSILNYFYDSHSLKDVRYFPKDFNLNDTDKVLGFSNSSTYNSLDKYFSFTKNLSSNTIDIKGYDYLTDIRTRNYISENNDLNISFDNNSATIKIKYDNKEVYSTNFNSFLKTLTDKYGNNSNNLTTEEMILIDENEKVKVKFVFTDISVTKNESSEDFNTDNIDFYLLVKIK